MAFTNTQQGIMLTGGIQTGLTALAGGGATGASVLGAVNTIATCATLADSCILPAGMPAGSFIVVRNNGAAAANVFPPTGGTINGGTVTTGAVSVTNAKGALLVSTDATGLTWITAALAA